MKKTGTRGIDSFMVSLVTIKQIVTWITGDYSFHPTLLPLPDWIKDLGMECSPRLLKKKPWMGFSGGSDGKESACNAGDLGSIPGLGRSPGEGMAIHLSIVAWRIPWTEESGGLQSMGLQSQTRLSDLKKKKRPWTSVYLGNWQSQIIFLCVSRDRGEIRFSLYYSFYFSLVIAP